MKLLFALILITTSSVLFAQNSPTDSIYILDGDTVFVINNSTIIKSPSKIKTILETAKQYHGVKYKYAGSDYNGMDCSGFICTAFQSADIHLPRSSSAIALEGEYVEADYLQTGDLIFFKGRSASSIGHVAMVSKIEDGSIYIVHATTSRGVIEEKLENNTYFLNRWLFNKRIVY